MATNEPSGSGANSAQLKDDINSGRTGDKVPSFDLAAAPLGTDDEAAGTGPSAAAVATARAEETKRPAQIPPGHDAPSPPLRYWPWMVAVLAVAITAFVVLS